MNKCFITKLPSSVDNDNLPVLGQLRINWLKQSNLTNNGARYISFITNDKITVKVSGAHFTDSTLTSNLGNTKTITAADNLVGMYVSNDADAVLTIDNKYSLRSISNIKSAGDEGLTRSLSFDLEDIKYCTNLTTMSLYNTQVTGDISALSNLTNLQNLILDNAQVSGDISAISKLTNINVLLLDNDHISGDISAISNFTNAKFISLPNTQVSGDISAVSQLTALTTLGLSNTQVSGDIDSLVNLTKLKKLFELKNLSLTGDMSKIPAGVNFISQQGRKVSTNFTWTANGRQNATLLAMEDVPFDTTSMDNMLIDQATCTFRGTDSQPYTKIISVSGTRTSASDAAVTAIQNKGVTITGVTKQA